MDSGGTGIQGLCNLLIGPVAIIGTDIGFEQDPCMEQLGCRRRPGIHEGQ
jgi:hypothetical protein